MVDVAKLYAIMFNVCELKRFHIEQITQSVVLLEGLKGGQGRDVKRYRKRERNFGQRITSF